MQRGYKYFVFSMLVWITLSNSTKYEEADFIHCRLITRRSIFLGIMTESCKVLIMTKRLFFTYMFLIIVAFAAT